MPPTDSYTQSPHHVLHRGKPVVALILGILALALAFFQPQNDSTHQGFLLSGVGITAIFVGLHSLRAQRRSVTARLGVVFGAIGSGAMAYTLAAFLLVPTGIVLPSLPWTFPTAHKGTIVNETLVSSLPPAPAAVAAAAAPAPDPAVPASAAVPAPAAPALPPISTRHEEWRQVVQATGTLSFTLELNTPNGAPWPERLVIRDRSVVLSPNGSVLAHIPTGATLIYTTSSDRSQYSIILSGPAFGVVAQYDSVRGVVESQG